MAKETRVFSAQKFFLNKYNTVADEKEDFDLKHIHAVFLYRGFETIMNALNYIAIICLSLLGLRSGKMTYGGIVTLLSYSRAISSLVSQLNYIYDMWNSNSEIYKTIVSLEENETPPEQKHLPALGSIKTISANHLSFSYRDKLILSDLDLKIFSGQKIAILGRSGTGKSTLLKILLGIIPVQQNQLFYNGLDSARLDFSQFRRNISYLSQVPFLFHGTIFENIQWANPGISEKETRWLFNQVRMEETSLQKEIGEAGKNLSGGERQRLAFVKCLAKNSPVMILDEPFSQLDHQSEKIIADIIKQSTEKTIILSTHREFICRDMDQVISLNGEVLANEKDNN